RPSPGGPNGRPSCAAGQPSLRPPPRPAPSRHHVADLLDKLQVLRVECAKCGRFGRYPLHRLIERHGGNSTVIDWLAELTADCLRKHAASISDQCALPRFNASPAAERPGAAQDSPGPLEA